MGPYSWITSYVAAYIHACTYAVLNEWNLIISLLVNFLFNSRRFCMNVNYVYEPELPDSSWYNKPKHTKMYQKSIKCTKSPLTVPNSSTCSINCSFNYFLSHCKYWKMCCDLWRFKWFRAGKIFDWYIHTMDTSEWSRMID
jgi:hypothetical protein